MYLIVFISKIKQTKKSAEINFAIHMIAISKR